MTYDVVRCNYFFSSTLETKPTTTPVQEGFCPPGWTKWGTDCYWVNEGATPGSWEDSNAFCQGAIEGANLLSIHSNEENAIVQEWSTLTWGRTSLWLGMHRDSLSGKAYNDTCDETMHKCTYLTPEQFHLDPEASRGNLKLFNANIRSISKHFESLKECIKTLNSEFTVIRLSETHLKDQPNNLYNLDGFNFENVNRIGLEKGGVCLYVTEKVKYKLRTDLCIANSSFQ